MVGVGSRTLDVSALSPGDTIQIGFTDGSEPVQPVLSYTLAESDVAIEIFHSDDGELGIVGGAGTSVVVSNPAHFNQIDRDKLDGI